MKCIAGKRIRKGMINAFANNLRHYLFKWRMETFIRRSKLNAAILVQQKFKRNRLRLNF